MNRERDSLAIILVLGIVLVAVVVGGLYLASIDKDLNGELIALGAGSLGALAQRLPGARPSDVTVTNSPNDPVPTETV